MPRPQTGADRIAIGGICQQLHQEVQKAMSTGLSSVEAYRQLVDDKSPGKLHLQEYLPVSRVGVWSGSNQGKWYVEQSQKASEALKNCARNSQSSSEDFEQNPQKQVQTYTCSCRRFIARTRGCTWCYCMFTRPEALGPSERAAFIALETKEASSEEARSTHTMAGKEEPWQARAGSKPCGGKARQAAQHPAPKVRNRETAKTTPATLQTKKKKRTTARVTMTVTRSTLSLKRATAWRGRHRLGEEASSGGGLELSNAAATALAKA